MFVSRQKSLSTGSSHDDHPHGDQPVLNEGAEPEQMSVVSDSHTAVSDSHVGVSDSHTSGMGMEDSGFGSGNSASWRVDDQHSVDQDSSKTDPGKEGVYIRHVHTVAVCFKITLMHILYVQVHIAHTCTK